MKKLEINEKSQKNQGGVFTKLLISQLVIAKEYKPWNQINDKTLFSTILSNMQIKVILIFINIYKNIRNWRKITEKLGIYLQNNSYFTELLVVINSKLCTKLMLGHNPFTPC